MGLCLRGCVESGGSVHADPRTACFYARRALELVVDWAYKHDATLKLPYQDNLSALIHEPSFKQAAGEAVFSKARVINTLGNRAVHSHRSIPEADELTAVRDCSMWLTGSLAPMHAPSDRIPESHSIRRQFPGV
jgi:type I restriction enzyme R subunit